MCGYWDIFVMGLVAWNKDGLIDWLGITDCKGIDAMWLLESSAHGTSHQ